MSRQLRVETMERLGYPAYYHPALARLLESIPTAILLERLIYWDQHTKDPDGWVWKTAEQWYKELAMTKDVMAAARAKLLKLGVIEVKQDEHSWNHRYYYKLNREKLEALLADLPGVDGGKGAIDGGTPPAIDVVKPAIDVVKPAIRARVPTQAPMSTSNELQANRGRQEPPPSRSQETEEIEEPPEVTSQPEEAKTPAPKHQHKLTRPAKAGDDDELCYGNHAAGHVECKQCSFAERCEAATPAKHTNVKAVST